MSRTAVKLLLLLHATARTWSARVFLDTIQ
jgi:hypothetical protein